jgi:hypothetical protein
MQDFSIPKEEGNYQRLEGYQSDDLQPYTYLEKMAADLAYEMTLTMFSALMWYYTKTSLKG